MRRDLDLIRSILLSAENAEAAFDGMCLVNGPRTPDVVGFHVELAASHGLIRAKVDRSNGGRVANIWIESLTWEGYDYLDAIRSPKVWGKAKEAIREAVGDTSLSVVKEVCSMVATSLVKAQLGL